MKSNFNQINMSKPVHLNKLSKGLWKTFLDSFDHVFSDCDGVIWTNTPLPGSGEFFKLIKKLGKSVNYVSNNSIRTQENYRSLFAAAGIENGFERLTLPSVAIAEYLKSVNFAKHVYCVSCPETVRVLEENGIKCKHGPDTCVEDYHDFADYLEDDPDIGAVVFDSDFKVNLPKLYKAYTYLKRSEVMFINGSSDRYVPLKSGCIGLGTDIFTNIVEQELNRTGMLMCKPAKTFGELAMRRAKVTDASRVLFIGDMIEQDVGLGKAIGFNTLLVLTNNTEQDMYAHKTITPDYYASNLGDLVPMLNELM